MKTPDVIHAYNWHMYDAKMLGKNVMLLRRDLGMTQDALATVAGISRAYLTNIERGRGTSVGIDIVFALADALGVSAGYLLGATDSPLGESDAKVMKELAGEYVTVDVESDEERRLVRSLMDEFNMLPRRAQQTVVEMVRLLRRMESDEPLVEDADVG